MSKPILIVMTSHDQLGSTGKKTGFHWEEMTTPYYYFKDQGFKVTLASIQGGRPPADPSSFPENEADRAESVKRFLADDNAMSALDSTKPVDKLVSSDYDAIYLPGGHGTMWDLSQSVELNQLITEIYRQGGIVSAVCHGPAGLIGPTDNDGDPIVKGKRINSFTNQEEDAADLSDIVPFLLETRLKELGAKFECNNENYAEYAVSDQRIITGQNPASCRKLAELVVTEVKELSATSA